MRSIEFFLKMQVERWNPLNIKINNNAVLLYNVSLLAKLFVTVIHLIITFLTIVVGVVTVFYSTKCV